MKIIIHGMDKCPLCKKLKKIFKDTGIAAKYIIDDPQLEKPYPYITLEYQYEEKEKLIRDLFWLDGSI